MTIHIPQQQVCPPVDDTVKALPAPKILPFPGVPVRKPSSGLWRQGINEQHKIKY